MIPSISHPRALGSPQRPRAGGFTLIEIMIVVSIVTILSFLAMIAIGRIKDRAARSLIENNLRQIYQAKEYYYSETGDTNPVTFTELSRKGYVRKSLFTNFTEHGSLETKMGWRYNLQYKSGEPIYARLHANSKGTGTILETTWYPAPPEGAAANTGSSGNAVTPPPLIPQPPVVVQQPPTVVQPPPTLVQPPVVVAQPPVTTATVSPDVAQPPAMVVQPPAVIAQPPITTTTVNPSGTQGQSNPVSTSGANQPPANQHTPNNSPGNSAHGHAQGHGQGHGNNKP